MSQVPFIVHDGNGVGDAENGEILRTGWCGKKMIALQAHSGEYVIEGEANDRLHRIRDGKVTAKTDEEIAAEETLQRSKASLAAEPFRVTQEQWAAMEARLAALEAKQGKQ